MDVRHETPDTYCVLTYHSRSHSTFLSKIHQLRPLAVRYGCVDAQPLDGESGIGGKTLGSAALSAALQSIHHFLDRDPAHMLQVMPLCCARTVNGQVINPVPYRQLPEYVKWSLRQ